MLDPALRLARPRIVPRDAYKRKMTLRPVLNRPPESQRRYPAIPASRACSN